MRANSPLEPRSGRSTMDCPLPETEDRIIWKCMQELGIYGKVKKADGVNQRRVGFRRETIWLSVQDPDLQRFRLTRQT
jgi:hypothetical protein